MELQPNLKKLLDFLAALMPAVPTDAILVILLAKLSQIAMMHRLQIKSYHYIKPTLVNLYVLNFMRSSSGKDRAISEINTLLMPPYYQDIEKLREGYRINHTELIAKLADIECETETQKSKYIQENRPRTLIDVFQDATVEGFVATREEYEKAKFGGTLTVISEFSDYILGDNAVRQQFLSIIKDVYEEGDNEAKIIKMTRTAKAVRGVPNSILFQSSPDGLLNEKGSEKLLAFLNRGIARRSLVCFNPSKRTLKKLPYAEHIESKNKLLSEKIELQNIVARMVNIDSQKNIFEFTKEADELLYNNIFVQYESSDESIEAELNSRPRKTAKLAGLLALIEHPSKQVVTLEDMESAFSITNYFGMYLSALVSSVGDDKITLLYKFFLNNFDKEFTKTSIREQRFVGYNAFTAWFSGAIEEVKLRAQIEGYILEEREVGSIGKCYRLRLP